MSGIVPIDSKVEIVTSSEDSTVLPPLYLAAKRPRLVAVGKA